MKSDAATKQPDSEERHRLQLAAISTAAFGYWTERDEIQPEYDTVALRDVAKLFAKHAELSAAYAAIYESQKTLGAKLVRSSPLSGSALKQICKQLSMEPYQVRAIEQAHGIT